VTYRRGGINGELGAVAVMDGRLFSVPSFVNDGERIAGKYNVRNPDKRMGATLRDLAV
jgi:hypothetical protein